ncbi:MAG: NAD-dependent epimerase/dehydratase family protein [Bacteroidetes bacterium]|nr:NAD-dependent epimerase/dehydratase family protein [Bacteroidota bacterium]MBK9423888.1 NAD-dependent epimerase/dehydratase family protein [Bacteroidota bacterium]
MSTSDTVLVLGAAGQIGTDLVMRLRNELGSDKVIATDVKNQGGAIGNDGPFHTIDVMNGQAMAEIIDKYKVTHVYHLAALLSATAEKNPMFGWKLNMEGLFNLLEIAREKKSFQIFWPSSIAVFGPTTPAQKTPQHTIMEPTTVYGISKQAGERWCEYYFNKYGVDVRSIRYPGLISYKSAPGGGTTDYAVDIYHKALDQGTYECFLSANTVLPMMYMHDALDATINLMHAPAEKVKIRSSYNVAAISFDPQTIAASIQKHIPDFTVTYKPDFRQAIADSWPQSIDDSAARTDWGWKEKFDLTAMTADMLLNLKKQRDITPSH